VVWVGVFILSLARGVGIIGVISPVLMYVLLNYVSGVPLLEKKYAGRPDFEEYKKETSIFFPWFKRKGRSVDIENK
jgi:steroid 5-alpha reductase family enzyme